MRKKMAMRQTLLSAAVVMLVMGSIGYGVSADPLVKTGGAQAAHQTSAVTRSQAEAFAAVPDVEQDAHSHHEHMDMDMDMEMELAPDNPGGMQVEWAWADGMPRAGEPATLRLTILDAEGMPVPAQQLEVNHEKKLHLIIVSRGLSRFMHVHPVDAGETGVFEVPITFAAAGDYKLIADFRPVGSGSIWRSDWARVQGEASNEPVLLPDKQLERSAEGMNVNLNFAHPPQAGVEDEMTFTFEQRADGAAVTDLEPYLGSVGHVVIVDSEIEHYLHVHPMNERTAGPAATFSTTFPTSGQYKIWGQFQRGGSVIIVPFVVNVK
ncbi:hypothetical protein ACFPYJ_11815 [Paenibacillus solisilvae]|uniref:Secreted protein n=1 Tax=Paenibacillus solisilvae TaxID=2486751 RepID=A0ABW0W047_9BACL